MLTKKVECMRCMTFCTKVFRLFDFGHFFCPFFKTHNTFRQKVMQHMHCYHNALISFFLLKKVLA